VIGVKAIDKDGNQSLVAAYDLPAPLSPARRDDGTGAPRTPTDRQ